MGSDESPGGPVWSGPRPADGTTSIGMAFGGIVPIAAAGLLVAVRGHIQNTNVALLLTVVVVAAAAFGGRPAGATAAVSAAMSFNFFHTRPYLSLKIASGDDVETTVLLLVVGLAVGQLARRARSASAQVKTSRSELDRIRRLADDIAGQHLRAWRDRELGLEWPSGPVALPVLARGEEAGRFVLLPAPESAASLEQRVVAVALADQAGGALVAAPPHAAR